MLLPTLHRHTHTRTLHRHTHLPGFAQSRSRELAHLSPNRFICAVWSCATVRWKHHEWKARRFVTFRRAACCVTAEVKWTARHHSGPCGDRSRQSDIEIDVRLPPVITTRWPCQRAGDAVRASCCSEMRCRICRSRCQMSLCHQQVAAVKSDLAPVRSIQSIQQHDV